MIHEIEVLKGLGHGGFGDLPRDEQADLLGWFAARTYTEPVFQKAKPKGRSGR